MVVMRLNDSMSGNLGDVLIRLNLHGMSTIACEWRLVLLVVDRRDDLGAVGTPAPQTPPSATTLLTLAQYQAQSSNPSMAAGTDGIRFLEQTTWDRRTQIWRTCGAWACKLI